MNSKEIAGGGGLRQKKPIPKFPRRVGVITSPTGAVIRDIISVSGRRFPAAEILLYPANVQGAAAVGGLIAGLKYFNETKRVDVIILGRGGGSIEDLWAFNDERLVRLVAASEIPVISAVGHETDFTLCDFAADLRAPTPSAAAELAFPDGRQILQSLADSSDRLDALMSRQIRLLREKLELHEKTLGRLSPAGRISEAHRRLDHLYDLLCGKIDTKYSAAQAGLAKLSSRLDDLSPLSVLARGFTLVRDTGGGILRSASKLSAGEKIEVVFSDGMAFAVVETVLAPNKPTGEEILNEH